MPLTIRMNEEQEKLVERVRGMMGEAVRSRTLLRAVAEYESLREENERWKERVRELEDWLTGLRDAHRARAEALAAADRAVDDLAELERQAEEDLGLPERPRPSGYSRRPGRAN